jgi:hypothetical protein
MQHMVLAKTQKPALKDRQKPLIISGFCRQKNISKIFRDWTDGAKRGISGV